MSKQDTGATMTKKEPDPIHEEVASPSQSLGMVPVLFIRPWRNYRADDIAGFTPDIAEQLIEQQFATAYQG